MFERIVVALDGSEVAEQALGPATELAGRLSVPLHLVRVADATRFRFGANEAALEYAALGRVLEEEEVAAREYLGSVQARLAADGAPVTSEIRRGLAPQALVEGARPGDLLVLASHGRTGPARWLLGSVAEDVVRHATVPVLLIRTQEASADG